MFLFRFNRISIRNKLVALVVFSLLFVAISITAVFVGQELSSFRSSAVNDLTSLARVLSVSCAAPLEFADSETASEVLSSLLARPQIHEAAVYRGDQKIFAYYLSASADGSHKLPGQFPYIIEEQGEEAFFFLKDHLELYVPILMDENVLGTLLLRADLHEFTDKLTRTVYLVGGILAASLLFAWLASFILHSYISNPILTMAAVLRRVRNEKEYAVRINNEFNDEFGILADGFNSMLDRIQVRDKQLLDAKLSAEEANRAKSTFLAQMSHEIRTPMNGVLGIASLLHTTPLNKKQTEFVHTISSSGEALLQVINDILDFSKIEAGKLELEEIPFNLRKAADEAIGLFSEPAGQKGLTLSCLVDPKTPQGVKGDPGRLRQVLMNLLGNAIKFTSQGEVCLRIRPEKSGDEGVHLRFEVTDTGIGIPPNKQETIFSAFSQADESTTREFGGTGLGLVISKQLIELQGGKIGVVSEVGKGSTFWFTTKYTVEKECAVSLTNHCQLCEKGMVEGLNHSDSRRFNAHILVVEDNLTNQLVTGGVLEILGCSVDVVENGLEALDAVKLHNFDAIFMDCQMPLMDGYEASGIIRKDERQFPNKHTPIIALTAHAMKGDRAQCLAAGMDDYLSKPCTEGQITEILKKWLPHTIVKDVVDKDCFENNRGDDISIKSHNNTSKPAAGVTSIGQNYDMKILVVDDVEINQQVAVDLLQYLGCKVDSVSNGKLAVDVVSRKLYDLIFMDCQMPVMNGYRATAAIRSMETSKVLQKRIPIIGLTGSSQKEDRDKCLSAGMDDYISKPFVLNEVVRILEHWSSGNSAQQTKDTAMAGDRNEKGDQEQSPDKYSERMEAKNPPPIDRSVIHTLQSLQIEGEPDILSKIINIYLTGSDPLIDELREAHGAKDFEKVQNVAHSLKSSSANVGAMALSELCNDIEVACKHSAVDKTTALVAAVELEFLRVKDTLSKKILSA